MIFGKSELGIPDEMGVAVANEETIRNAAQRACRTQPAWRDAAWRGAIGAVEQIVHNNNNKLITEAKVKQNFKKMKKVLKKFSKNLKQF